MKHIVHTSERTQFKKCRQMWDFASPNRQALTPKYEAQALRFGTAVHAGLEHYYDPVTWPLPDGLGAAMAFTEAYPFIGDENTSDEDRQAWRDEVQLGIGMLRHYAQWAKSLDTFTPIGVETSFELPIDGVFCSCPNDDHDRQVYYAGRIDLILKDEHDNLWLVDHKTAKGFKDTEWLALDDQCGSYLWAAQKVTGKQFKGIIYNELLKALPSPPAVLKNGNLSVNKNQNTTLDLFLRSIKEGDYDAAPYLDVLEHLRAQGNKFFRRTQVSRSQRELEILEKRIATEAQEMVRPDVAIYPTPGPFNCAYCDFKAPCMGIQDGSEIEFMITDQYKKREVT